MSYSTVVTARFAPIDRWQFAHGRYERFTPAAFEKQGLSKYPELNRTIPVDLRHEKNKVAGSILAVWPSDGWWHARFELGSGTYGFIADNNVKVGTPVSCSFAPVVWRDVAAGARLYEQGWLTGLAVLMYEQRPAYAGAEVTLVERPRQPEMSRAEVDELLVRARSLPPPSPLPEIRRWGPSDPAEIAYAEDAQRRGSIVRFGSGQVLGVR